ncbi:CHAD domain-containing protein [Seleniivibrio woodruffii]|uniref:CHAD domain-containing protein n=1 Tax=Seleniivibrio woodruffii TaxID=1078050 RepID=UPI002409E644|nr:CHAD domain-containing protein [Seleniivibrio woodruffii]
MPYYISDIKPASDRKFRLRYRKLRDYEITVFDTFEWQLVRSGRAVWSDGKDKFLFDKETDTKAGYAGRYLFEKLRIPVTEHSFDAGGIKGRLYAVGSSYIIYTEEPQEDFAFHYCAEELKGFGQAVACAAARCGDPMLNYTTRVQCPADSDAILWESMQRVHSDLINIMRLNTDGILKGYDAEFLHDFRVSVRRSRSAMSMLKGVYSEDREMRFRQFFKSLGEYTGRARDMDVYLEELEGYEDILPDDMKQSLEPLKSHFRAERDKSYELLQNFLTSEEYNNSLAEWERLINSRAEIGRRGFVNTSKAAAKALAKIFGRVELMTGGVDGESEDAQIHSVRIAFKKLRYCIEFFGLFIKEQNTADVLTRLRSLQDSLGRYNDLSVQCGHMQERLNSETDPKLLAACGYIMAVLAMKKAQEREQAVELIRIFRKGKKRVKKSLGI